MARKLRRIGVGLVWNAYAKQSGCCAIRLAERPQYWEGVASRPITDCKVVAAILSAAGFCYARSSITTAEWEWNMPWIAERAAEISWDRLQALMDETVAEARERICSKPKRVLLLPPDITRMHSGAGKLTEMLYN